jgi:hypothetical protein
MAFFSKTNVMIQFLHNLALFEQKTPIFSTIFLAKIFFNHNIGPRDRCYDFKNIFSKKMAFYAQNIARFFKI